MDTATRVRKVFAGRPLFDVLGARALGRANSMSCTTSASTGEGWVYVADRENHRVQIFDGNGRLKPNGTTSTGRTACTSIRKRRAPSVSSAKPGRLAVNRKWPNLGPRISILDNRGAVLSRFGELGPGTGAGVFLSPHGMAVDSRGDIYVGEVVRTAWPKYYPNQPIPPDLKCLHKYVRVSGKEASSRPPTSGQPFM